MSAACESISSCPFNDGLLLETRCLVTLVVRSKGYVLVYYRYFVSYQYEVVGDAQFIYEILLYSAL